MLMKQTKSLTKNNSLHFPSVSLLHLFIFTLDFFFCSPPSFRLKMLIAVTALSPRLKEQVPPSCHLGNLFIIEPNFLPSPDPLPRVTAQGVQAIYLETILYYHCCYYHKSFRLYFVSMVSFIFCIFKKSSFFVHLAFCFVSIYVSLYWSLLRFW